MRRGVACLLFVTLLACGVPPVDPPEIEEPPPIIEPEPDAGTPWPTSCETTIPGADAILAAGETIILGEIHGTEQVPRFVAALACEAALRKIPVKVGLEFPLEEQPLLDAWLASTGDAAARQALLGGDFWQRDLQDGRSSEAAVQLLEALRQLRPAVTVFAFDGPVEAGTTRDLAMAQRIREERARAALPLLLIQTGNVHAWLQKGAPWDAEFEPMARDLLTTDPGLLSLDVAHAGGAAWICTGIQPADCGVRTLTGPHPADAFGIELFAQPGKFHGRYQVGTLTASPPPAS